MKARRFVLEDCWLENRLIVRDHQDGATVGMRNRTRLTQNHLQQFPVIPLRRQSLGNGEELLQRVLHDTHGGGELIDLSNARAYGHGSRKLEAPYFLRLYRQTS